ncbi:MAG: T9SS type A sorting domain-containing protein, partial [Flavobacteriales bacterium]
TDVEEVTVDVFDLFGRRVLANTIATDGAEELSTVLAMPKTMVTGVYLVNITAGTLHYSERLMVE